VNINNAIEMLSDLREALGGETEVSIVVLDDNGEYAGYASAFCSTDSGLVVPVSPSWGGPEHTLEPPEDHFRNDVEADADTLASAGYGTDEDYGCYGSADDHY